MFKNIMKKAAVVLTLVQSGYALPAFADADEAAMAVRRVDIAGRQRMLSQRMAKAACFVATGVDAEAQQTVLRNAYYLFALSHDALVSGDPILGLTPETSPELLEGLSVVGKDWSNFSRLVMSAIREGYVSESALVRIDDAGLVLLGDMNKAVGETAIVYSAILPSMPLVLSITIDIAGRQRMLTQRAAKEFCLIDAGIDVEANRERLAETTTLFAITHGALIDGMAGMVMAAPNDHILNKLEQVSVAWVGPLAVLESTISGAPITNPQRDVMVQDLERVLTLMNEAVGMYEEAIPEPE